MNDPEIRALLYPMLTGGHLLDELPVGTTRADVLHLTPDFMHGYELKGDGDTLKRLENQVRCYSQSFDYVTFVVTSKHFNKALNALPQWVGLWSATPLGIVRMREAQAHDQLARAHIASLLWQDEIKCFMQERGMKGLSKYRLWELFGVLEQDTTIPTAALAAFVRQRLIDRLPQRLAQRAALKVQRQEGKEREAERQAGYRRLEALMQEGLLAQGWPPA